MIISKKKLEAEIQKAVNKREDELWRQRRQEDDARDIWRNIYEMRERLDKLEGKNVQPECVPCNPVNIRAY